MPTCTLSWCLQDWLSYLLNKHSTLCVHSAYSSDNSTPVNVGFFVGTFVKIILSAYACATNMPQRSLQQLNIISWCGCLAAWVTIYIAIAEDSAWNWFCKASLTQSTCSCNLRLYSQITSERPSYKFFKAWSCHCRSAYFRLGSLIEDKVPCKKILALTATATKTTQTSIRGVLKITDDPIREGAMPNNIRLSVQRVQAGKSAKDNCRSNSSRSHWTHAV